MPAKPIIRLMPHAVPRPGYRPRRLSLAACLAAAATLIACLAAGLAPAAAARAPQGVVPCSWRTAVLRGEPMSTAETIAESPAGSWAVRRVAAWWAMAVAVADPLP